MRVHFIRLPKYNIRIILLVGIVICTITTLFAFFYLHTSIKWMSNISVGFKMPMAPTGVHSLNAEVKLSPHGEDSLSTHPNLPKRLPFDATDSILAELEEAMRYSWKAYTSNAWGKDEALVLSKSGTVWMNAALTMVDSLDTLWLYGMKTEFNDARDWIKKHVNFDYNTDRVSVFESTIRLLGGLQTAFHLSQDHVFLDKAQLIGNKLLSAFVSSSGLPKTDINFFNEYASYPNWGQIVSLAEVATVQLEFNDLALALQRSSIAMPPANVYKALKMVERTKGLLPVNINPSKLTAISPTCITLGARGDSYYEYLLKVWVQLGKPENFLKYDYLKAIEGVKTLLVRYSLPNHLTFIGELINGKFSPKMDHLVCFLPGTLAYGVLHGMPEEHLTLAKELARTCFAMYNQTSTGLSSEIVYFNLANNKKNDFYIKRSDAHNLLRPEFVESLFYLYHITKDNIYRVWGKQVFNAFQKYSRFPEGGYTSIADVTRPDDITRHDKMESFWLAETLKYFLLLFSDEAASKVDLHNWVFNTEAHPFPIPKDSKTLASLIEAYNLI